MGQHYISPENYREETRILLRRLGARNIFLVCGRSCYHLPVYGFLEELQAEGKTAVTCFDGFSPNPDYRDIVKGVEVFKENHCDFVLAIGGGSAIDTAKCIKLFAGQEGDGDYLERKPAANGIPLMAVPTTAGTGSEATQFAVIYVNGEKCSVEHESLLPGYVLLYPENLKSLPDYQKKATVCDALAHGIESCWSIHSSDESRNLAESAIRILVGNMDAYLRNDERSYPDMMLASNLAGSAINMTRTTAAHAMCYRLASIMNISHGHAVMLCLPEVWEYMQENLDACVDRRGRKFLEEKLVLLAGYMGQKTPENAIVFLKNLCRRWGLDISRKLEDGQMDELVDSVNAERLRNFPIDMGKEGIRHIYRKIMR